MVVGGASAWCNHTGLLVPIRPTICACFGVNCGRGPSGHIPQGGVSAVSFIEVLRKTKAEALGQSHPPAFTAEQRMPWVEILKKSKVETLARSGDPWKLRLERVRGKTGYDGVERISTQDVFDLLDVPQRARTAGACRRLATLMRELGWTPVKARGMTQSGFRDQVRGYAREVKAAAAT